MLVTNLIRRVTSRYRASHDNASSAILTRAAMALNSAQCLHSPSSRARAGVAAQRPYAPERAPRPASICLFCRSEERVSISHNFLITDRPDRCT
ncbi:hypothetical protein NPIL_271921 [Nephila pilipes]|uniref:Uncharacterized protein n=1 Tax=Nephila pilipes TaxID=299642 RepID=A0A8X6P3Z5_NEPPI|nr:hypothetical protein NPIL_271921 [Nephila pilipes]